MRYAIITNPVSGNMTVDQKRTKLADPARILNAEIHGLDTGSVDEFFACAQDLSSRCDVLVAAGGDGTLSDVINAVDTRRTPAAYLPLGSGNAMAHALNARGSLSEIAAQIKNGEIHDYDLIDCDGKARAFMTSVGIDGLILHRREQYTNRGFKGFKAYFLAVFRTYFRGYTRASAKMSIDGRKITLENLLSLIVVKQPFYGYGMRVVPKAKFDDGLLHILLLDSGFFAAVFGGITAFTSGNRIGQYLTGREMSVKLSSPSALQFNGNVGWTADAFNFTVLSGALRIKC